MFNRKLKTFEDLVKVAGEIRLTIIEKERLLNKLKDELQANRKDKLLLHKIGALEDEIEALKAIHEGLEDSIKKKKEVNMIKNPVKKAKDEYNKAIREIKQFKAKITELEEKIKAIEDQNKSLREEAGAILAKVNLGELPPESRKEVDQKMQAIEQNKLEIEGLKFAIKELEKRSEEKKNELNKLKVDVYLALREKLFDLIEKELKRYVELAPQIKESHQKLIFAVDWINKLEFYAASKWGYQRDGKAKEKLARFYRGSIDMLSLPECHITIPDSQPGKYKRCFVDLTDFWEKFGLKPTNLDTWSDQLLDKNLHETLMLERLEKEKEEK